MMLTTITMVTLKTKGIVMTSDASIYPGAKEICGDGIDQDCDGIDATCNSIVDGGFYITSSLWSKAILEISGSPINLIWTMVGADIAPSGDQVISGYFYADPCRLCLRQPL